MPNLSFVIPVHNEQSCLDELVSRIRAVAETAAVTWEIIFIDDASTDGTLDRIREWHRTTPQVKAVAFSRNFGHQIAVAAGLTEACGDCVVVMDGDLQDPPELVSEMLKRWRDGTKIVYGVRKKRQESLLKRICYASFYRLLRMISPQDIPLDAGDFCLLDRQVVDEMNRLREDRPFIRGFRAWVGFSQAGLEYDRPLRAGGESKYDAYRLFTLALDGLISFSDLSLRLSGLMGLGISGLSMAYGAYISVMHVLISMQWVRGKTAPRGWTSLVCSLTFLVGLQFLFLGILGEYIGRIFIQTKQRPLYVKKESIGLPA